MAEPDRVAVAVDVGGTSIKGALVDGEGRCSAVRRLPVVAIAPDDLVATVLATVEGLLDEGRRTGRRPVAVGLAVAGLVDATAGVARSSMMLGWRDVPFRSLLEPLGLPVAFGHDVVAGAYAEAVRGSGAGLDNWLFVALGTGLGAAFVLDGRPYRGARGRGGELAHVRVRRDGPVCRCGKRGCAEMMASADAVVQAYRTRRPDASGVATAREVADRARAGDPEAQNVWHQAVLALADVVAGYVESMDPGAVVVGGGLAESRDQLLLPLVAALDERVRFLAPAPPVRLAHFGQDAGLVGTGLAAHDAARPGHGPTGWPFGLARSAP